MASTVRASFKIAPNAAEVFSAADLPSIGATTLNYAVFNRAFQLNAGSTPPVTKIYAEELTGSAALDLTALSRSIGGTVDGSGLKVRGVAIVNESSTNTVTLADGDANAYQLQAGESILVQPGAPAAMLFMDALADIDATHKALKTTATEGQKYLLLILMG
jgi:hypothetical protein